VAVVSFLLRDMRCHTPHNLSLQYSVGFSRSCHLLRMPLSIKLIRSSRLRSRTSNFGLNLNQRWLTILSECHPRNPLSPVGQRELIGLIFWYISIFLQMEPKGFARCVNVHKWRSFIGKNLLSTCHQVLS
jgi:hypothetical protein